MMNTMIGNENKAFANISIPFLRSCSPHENVYNSIYTNQLTDLIIFFHR